MPKIKKVKEVPSKIKIISESSNDKDNLESEIQDAETKDFNEFISGNTNTKNITPTLEQGDFQENPSQAQRSRISRSSQVRTNDNERRTVYDTAAGIKERERRYILPNSQGGPSLPESRARQNTISEEQAFKTQSLTNNSLLNDIQQEEREKTYQEKKPGEQTGRKKSRYAWEA